MAVPPAHDQPAGLTENTHDDPTRSTTFRLALTGVLAVLLVLSLGASIWLTATRGFEAIGIDRGAGELQSERDQVMSRTRQFMLRTNTFGPDQLEDGKLTEYRRLVTEVITPKFATSFEREVTAAEQIVSQAGVARTTEVFAAGVRTIDADSATALVAGTFITSYPDDAGELQPQEPVPFRVEVILVKTEGEWLVDDFSPVTGAQP